MLAGPRHGPACRRRTRAHRATRGLHGQCADGGPEELVTAAGVESQELVRRERQRWEV